MKNKILITGALVIGCSFLLGGIVGFTSEAVEHQDEISRQIQMLEALMLETSERYEARAEEARTRRAHCAIADALDQELTDMQSQNNARRKQLKMLKSMIPKGTGNQQ